MGERKGTNKYYPPDYDPKKGGLNSFLGTHALRERARKLHLGILIIRFEMPYNIWCEGCENHIGMGVRYNAEKSKVGMYYTTPVYKFRMKCHLCPNHIEMQTDPGNLDYIILSGARRQERRWDPTENGQVVPDDKQVIRQLSSDAMFKLEHGMEDKTKLKSVTPTLAKLEGLQERWKDDYLANKLLRSHFRTKKKELKAIEDKDNEYLKKNALDIPLLKESAEDSRIAALLQLEPIMTSEERQQEKRTEIENKSKFPTSSAADVKLQIDKFYEKNEKHRSSLGISIGSKVRNKSLTSSASSSVSASVPCSNGDSSVIECKTSIQSSNDSNDQPIVTPPSTGNEQSVAGLKNGEIINESVVVTTTRKNNKRTKNPDNSSSDDSDKLNEDCATSSSAKIPRYFFDPSSSTVGPSKSDSAVVSSEQNGNFSLVSGDYLSSSSSSDEVESS